MKNRGDGWGKETILSEMKEGRTLVQILQRYRTSSSVTVLEKEYQGWLRSDPEFNKAVREHSPPTPGSSPNKEMKGEALPEWREKFGEDYYDTGDINAAARLSPYSESMIHEKLSARHRNVDKRLIEIVAAIEVKMVKEFEGGFVKAFRDAQQPKDRAWIAKSWLERRAPERWGKQVEMIHSGTVKHDHSVELKPRDQMLRELMADQKAFGEKKDLALPAINENVIEGEIVEPATSRNVS